MLILAFLFIHGSAIAGESCVDQYISGAQDNIVLSAGNDSSVVIEEGRITSTEGNAVRLLPGTHIKRGEELTVSLISREHYDKLAREVAEKKRKQTITSLLARSDDIPEVTDALFLFRTMQFPPGSPVIMFQQQAVNAVLPVVLVQLMQPLPVSILQKHIPSYDIYDHFVSAFRPVYYPDYSWGERADCIKVMLA